MNNNYRILINVKQTEKKQKFQIHSKFTQNPQRNLFIYHRRKIQVPFGVKIRKVSY